VSRPVIPFFNQSRDDVLLAPITNPASGHEHRRLYLALILQKLYSCDLLCHDFSFPPLGEAPLPPPLVINTTYAPHFLTGSLTGGKATSSLTLASFVGGFGWHGPGLIPAFP